MSPLDYQLLYSLGYRQALSDMVFKYLEDQGYQGSTSDMLFDYLGDLGYVGDSTPDRLLSAAITQSYTSVADMLSIISLFALGESLLEENGILLYEEDGTTPLLN